jgi:hypothetical protein
MGDLEVLKLGATSDEVLKEFVEHNPSLEVPLPLSSLSPFSPLILINSNWIWWERGI